MRLYDDQPSGTVSRARQLRRDATAAEKRLLRALRDAFPNHKWRRQVPFGPYFADILCFAERLVIEVDGGQHAETLAYDTARTRHIERDGFRVLRFWNNDILENVSGVLMQVDAALQEKGDMADAKSPSPFRDLKVAPTLSHGERV